MARAGPGRPHFQCSATHGVGSTCRVSLMLRPAIASGGFGWPWKTTIRAPSGMRAGVHQQAGNRAMHPYLNETHHSFGQ